MLGINKVIWLPHGIVNDETNEHVDNMACFLDESTILLATFKDKMILSIHGRCKLRKFWKKKLCLMGEN